MTVEKPIEELSVKEISAIAAEIEALQKKINSGSLTRHETELYRAEIAKLRRLLEK
jgi:hypothetical protein